MSQPDFIQGRRDVSGPVPFGDGLTDPQAARTPGQDTRDGATVLVIDDEHAVRFVTTRMIEAFGYRAVAALDGEQGAAIFRERAAEIVAVLLDLTMPGLTGEETFVALRQIRPDIPIILMSGFQKDEAVERFGGHGGWTFLQKPFHAEALRQALDQAAAPP